VDPIVGIQVGDKDAPWVHAPLSHQEPIQEAAAPGHGAALADHDPRLQWIQDVDEVGELVAELLAQDADVLDAVGV
jgi:hypothetical protein